MSTFADRPITCPACGHAFLTRVFSSISTERMPDAPRWIMERTFQRADCPACHAASHAEQPVLYADIAGGLWVHCLPEQERGRWWEHEPMVAEIFERVFTADNAPPLVVGWGERLQKRVAFGYEELREKVLAHHHRLDDALLECLKLQLMLQLPALLALGAHGLTLEAAEDHLLLFAPRHDTTTLPPIPINRAVWDELSAQRDTLRLNHPSLFTEAFCNIDRYALLPPQES